MKDSKAHSISLQPQEPLSKNTFIMIIDDEEDILGLFNDFLQQQGYSVRAFAEPLLALQEIEKRPQEYSLIITDLRMPGMSGFQLIKSINRINKKIRIVLMSAFEISGEIVKGIRYDEYIQKPLHIRVLLDAVRKQVC